MDPRSDLEQIARASLAAVDPRAIISRAAGMAGSTLRVQTPGVRIEMDLGRFRRIFVLGFGKAAGPMAGAIEAALGPRIDRGLIVVKPGTRPALQRIRCVTGGHPVPDENSVKAAMEIAALADEADERTLVIALISGGGSSLIAAPLEGTEEGVTLADIQDATRRLLACGAGIQEINCLRRHLLLHAGGRLAGRIFPGTTLSLVMSDVVGDDLPSIASGPTSPDSSTFADALSIVDAYGIRDSLPAPIVGFLRAGAAGRVPETLKPGAAELASAATVIAATNLRALRAAAFAAERLGYHARILTSRLCGEAREAARMIAAVARDVAAGTIPPARPVCILAGGETTVTVRGSGQGGRNQEMALAFLREMEKDPPGFCGTHFLSFGTDGEDGQTTAAGGFALPSLVDAVSASGIRLSDFLARNDAHSCLGKLGGLFVTGPTGTNVCDLQITLVL